MVNPVKEAFLLVFILSISAIFVSAQSISVTCPSSSATLGETFTVTVTAGDPLGVNSVALSTNGGWGIPLDCEGDTICIKDFSVTAQDTNMLFNAQADANTDTLMTDEGCSVTIQTNTPPAITDFTVTQSPPSVYIKATDDVGLNQIRYFIEQGGLSETYSCDSDVTCQYTWSLTLSPGIYMIHAKAIDNFNPEVDYGSTKSITVTSSNTAPSFAKTSPNSIYLTEAKKGEAYSTKIEASDPEDTIAYSLSSGVSSIMSIDSSGLLTWGSPDSTRSFNVYLNDYTNPSVSQAFTIPVTQCTSDQSCYNGPAGTKDVGLCKSGTQKCTNGILGSCIGEVDPATEICDNLDNNCNNQIDEGCDDDLDGYCDDNMVIAAAVTGSTGICKNEIDAPPANSKGTDCDDTNNINNYLL